MHAHQDSAPRYHFRKQKVQDFYATASSSMHARKCDIAVHKLHSFHGHIPYDVTAVIVK